MVEYTSKVKAFLKRFFQDLLSESPCFNLNIIETKFDLISFQLHLINYIHYNKLELLATLLLRDDHVDGVNDI